MPRRHLKATLLFPAGSKLICGQTARGARGLVGKAAQRHHQHMASLKQRALLSLQGVRVGVCVSVGWSECV